MTIIKESGMEFGEYPDNDVFYLEQSPQYRALRSKGIKSCEFILRRDKSLYFIEAKTSSPKEINEYLSEITRKFCHSLILYAGILLKRHKYNDIGSPLLETDLSRIELKPVLVIKNAEKSWLPPLRDKLNAELRKDFLLWNINAVYVINEEMARKKHIII